MRAENGGNRSVSESKERFPGSLTGSLDFVRAVPTVPDRFPPLPLPVPSSLPRKGTGDGTGHGRLGRRPQPVVHPECQRPVLVGLDADRCALTATVDPYPLTPLGEVDALRDGRRTYLLLRGEMDRRDRWNIPGSPPSHQVLVLAEHRCQAPIPDAWRLPPAPAPKPAARTEGIPF